MSSKASRRQFNRQRERAFRQRQADEAEAKRRRLKGFKPASIGDMLQEITKSPIRTGAR